MPRFSDPERLTRQHTLAGFDCGTPSLNLWLENYAVAARGMGSARTYVVTDAEQDRVIGYHALAYGSSTREEATERASKGMPGHRIPAVVLARLAVDRSVAGRGIGALLLKDAMERTIVASEIAGARVVLVHAMSEDARRFYLHFGFEASPTHRMNLQMMLKDIRAALDR